MSKLIDGSNSSDRSQAEELDALAEERAERRRADLETEHERFDELEAELDELDEREAVAVEELAADLLMYGREPYSERASELTIELDEIARARLIADRRRRACEARIDKLAEIDELDTQIEELAQELDAMRAQRAEKLAEELAEELAYLRRRRRARASSSASRSEASSASSSASAARRAARARLGAIALPRMR